MNSTITAIGAYSPENILNNNDLEKMVETSDEWIVQRTGIKERRISKGETTVEMAEKACLDLAERYSKNLEDVDFIIFASSTGEHRIPSLSSQLQNSLGIKSTGAIDLIAACAGFVYGVTMAQSLIASSFYKKVLVVATEVLSNFTDYEDRNTCILFGDAATAVLIEPHPEAGFYKPISGTEGENGHVLFLSEYAKVLNGVEIKQSNKIVQDGRKVFKWAIARMSEKFNELLEQNNLKTEDIDYFVPHSANLRIIESICKKIGVDSSKALQSIVDFGNTSAASIPLAINKAVKEGRLEKNSKLVILGFGGGLTYSGTVIDWVI